MAKKDKGRKRSGKLFVLLIAAVILGVFGLLSYNFVTGMGIDSTKDSAILVDPENSTTVEIAHNANTASIAAQLKEMGIIQHPTVFRILSRINGYDGLYQAGSHLVDNDPERNNPLNIPQSYTRVMRILAGVGQVQGVRVTIPEGKTYTQIVDLLAEKGVIDREKFEKAAQSIDLKEFENIKDIADRKNRLEGYLFPDTYEFGSKATEEEIIRTMLENFNNKLPGGYPNDLKALNSKFKDLDMDLDKVITLASIIEREAQNNEERAIIAGVFYNRLAGKYNAPDRLESCATIQYIYLFNGKEVSEKDKARIAKGIIWDRDTAINDPYNTYKFSGLPPGPIASPGKASIEAALNPADTKYVFFVANKDMSGNHVFSETFAQHSKAVQENIIQ